MPIRRLRSRITLYFCVLMAVTSALTAWLVGTSLSRSLAEAARSRGMALARTVAHQVGEAIATHDDLELKHLLAHAAAGNPDVLYVLVTDADGRITNQWFADGEPARSETARTYDLASVARRLVTTPLREGSGGATDLGVRVDRTWSLVHVGVSHRGARVAAVEAMRNVVFSILLAMLTGIVFISFLAGVITQPIKRLRAAMRAVGHGDLAARAVDENTPPDELGELAREFDAMAARLTAALGELATERRRLEQELVERKELESSLAQSERLAALGVLASCVAHEVGNPLASIGTAVQGLLRRMDGPSGVDPVELKEYLEIVEKQVVRCRNVTTRLLGLARVPARTEAPVDLGLAVREVITLVRPQARAQKVSIELSLTEPLWAVAEELLVGQVLLNLVLNALQAMAKGGELTIESGSDPDGERVFVTVRDTGPGIPPAMRDRLFEPFRTARENGAGTGLGLFLTRTLLEQCGGTISVDSSEGGAAFTVHLARAPQPGIVPKKPVEVMR